MLSADRILRFPSVARILILLIPKWRNLQVRVIIPIIREPSIYLLFIQIKKFHYRRFSKKDLFLKLAEIDSGGLDSP